MNSNLRKRATTVSAKCVGQALLCFCLCAVSRALAAPSERAPLRLDQLIDDALRCEHAKMAARDDAGTEASRRSQTEKSLVEASDGDCANNRGHYERCQSRLVLHVKQAYSGLRHAYAAQDLIDSHRDSLRNLLNIARTNYSVGKGLQQDILQVQVQLSLIEAQRISVATDLHTREVEINGLLGRAPESPLSRPQEAKPLAISMSLDDLQRSAELASSRRTAAVPVNSEVQMVCNMSNDKLSTEAFDPPDAGQQLRSYRIAREYIEADGAAKEMSLLSSTVLPLARASAHSSLVAYEDGKAGFLEVLTNYKAVFEAEMSYQNEVEQLFAAAARLEELTGADLTR